ncbi:hypothetical protein AVEN_18677-1 [Araneus ventricosus]|uniref:Uncharacterized protein n=1 Tax=Araneus ventricosus TaxID=182803 RepID=A0A4Y2WX45_ARAVE|nr:hypothetical protein AVEN_18677-1 [Araneus ventricosus]
MAAPARSEIPNRSNVLTAAKTFFTTGSPVCTQPAQLLSWHQARGHGDTGRRSVTTDIKEVWIQTVVAPTILRQRSNPHISDRHA